jgi:hypothetical protein
MNRVRQAEINAFAAWMPSFKDSESLTVTYTPGDALTLHAPAAVRDFKGSADLARAVFRIWIGPNAVDAQLRNQLPGQST